MTDAPHDEIVGGVGGLDPELSPPFEIFGAPAGGSPLVFSSPHSGNVYPARFLEASRLDPLTLRRSEDAYVDDLFSGAAKVGAPLLRARFPRAFLDLNREPWEFDPKVFSEPLPGFANTRSLRVAAGLGTIPRVVSDARAIYREPLALAEGVLRVETLYVPYHAALRTLMEAAAARFGAAVLIDCHSMPAASAKETRGGERRALDFVIGDRFGASAAPGIVEVIERRLKGFGYAVQRNRPYAGGYITEHYGRPGQGWHAVQIETSRSLYMNEQTLERNPRFDEVRAHLDMVAADLAEALAATGEELRDAAE